MKSRKVMILILTWFMVLNLTLSGAGDRAGKIDDLMNHCLKNRQFNGVVLVADESGIVFEKGYGWANMEFDIPNTPDIKFRLGSVTKQFTSMLIMQLVQEEKIALDEKISVYLPYYRKDTGQKISIHHLLTHSSGIPSYTSQPGFFRNISRNYYSVKDFVVKHCMGDLEFEPGSKFAYNNSGYFLLGAIIEAVTQKKYRNVLRERIFAPLEMNDTGYDLYRTILPKRAAAYEKRIGGFRNADFLDMSVPFAAGALYSTVRDLYKWDRALYTEKLVSRKIMDKLFYPHIKANRSHYGYGWSIERLSFKKKEKPVLVTQHGGGINGFNTYVFRVIDRKQLVVLLNNTGGAPLRAITNQIMNILNQQKYDYPRQSAADFIYKKAESEGISAAIKMVKKQKSAYRISQGAINALGYEYLKIGKVADAVAVFRLNVELFPRSANTYDSLGEAYFIKGEKALSIINYKKSLELNPGNSGAREKLREMGVEVTSPEISLEKFSGKLLDSYTGDYQLAPNFVISITREGKRLFSRATGQNRFEMFASSKTRFFLKNVNAQIEFAVDESGAVSGLFLYQAGRRMEAKKIKK